MSDRNPCTDPRCTRVDGRCVGLHCTHCGKPCSSQGHTSCRTLANRLVSARGVHWPDIAAAIADSAPVTHEPAGTEWVAGVRPIPEVPRD